MVECVLTWIREQYLVVCNTAKWTILCIVVHFQPVIKLLQKVVRVHHRCVILMQKCKIFLGRGHSPLPRPYPIGASISTPPILKFWLCYWVILCQTLDVDQPNATCHKQKWGNIAKKLLLNVIEFSSSTKNDKCDAFRQPLCPWQWYDLPSFLVIIWSIAVFLQPAMMDIETRQQRWHKWWQKWHNLATRFSFSLKSV